MKIDPENRAVQGLSSFLEFVALNILFLLCCVPIVTIGASTSALLEVTRRYADEEGGRPLRDFLPALARNFLPATGLSLILLTASVALAFSGVFWLSAPEPLLTGLAALAFAGAAYAVAAFIHAMGLVAAYRAPFRQTLKNALLLPAAEPLRTLALLVIPVTVVCLVIVFPPTMFLVATIGFSVGAYGCAFLFRSIYRRRSGTAA
ncbi:YesL family protein [Microbacterium sp. 179-I 1D1 NHS]|uniref:YesL family protein n=1 Tax=Microbacterium sp. 179-I 1D1 NHS TaxID=3374298 RepID=UPI003879E2DF